MPVFVLQHPNTLLVELYSPLMINLKVVTWPQIGPDQLKVLRDGTVLTQEQSPLISRKSSQKFEAFYANALYSHAGSYSVRLPQLNFQSSDFNVKVIGTHQCVCLHVIGCGQLTIICTCTMLTLSCMQ